MTALPQPIADAQASAAAEIRDLLTCALHGQPVPEAIASRLPPALREAATPANLHLLRGRKAVIEATIAAVILHHHEQAAADLLRTCRGD